MDEVQAKFEELAEYLFKWECIFDKEIPVEHPYREILERIRKINHLNWKSIFNKELKIRIEITEQRKNLPEVQKIQQEIAELIRQKVDEYNLRVYSTVDGFWWNYPTINLLFYAPDPDYIIKQYLERQKSSNENNN